jgi:hypothetical protein
LGGKRSYQKMSILVDTVEDEFESLNPGIESAPTPTPVKEDPVVSTKELDTFVMPEKLKGKTAEEIAQIYVAEQSYVGEVKAQLGDYRSMTDRFLSLEEKRVGDLETAGQDDLTIDPTELLANPVQVLDDYYEKRRGNDPSVNALQQRLDALEGQVGQSSIEQKHPDAITTAQSPEFQSWVNGNSFRGRIAQQAIANKDVDALDYLLSEFKGTQTPAASEEDPASSTEVQRARSVVTESASSGNASVKSDKRFSRRKLVHLKMTNPDEYSARADEILMAYAQGRVDD